MHKAVILLVKASDRNEAISQTNEFMREYQDKVWDWWRIGGRWSGHLNGNTEKLHKLMEDKQISVKYYSDIEKEDTQKAIQELWKSLGETSLNPILRDSFLDNKFNNEKRFFLKEGDDFTKGEETDIAEAYSDDVLPLSQCMEMVKDWSFDYIQKGKEQEEHAKKWLGRENKQTGEKYDDCNMFGYCLKIAGDIYQQHFCFDCNVFNTKEYNYSIPEDTDGWYAVMIDMHN